MTCSIGFVVSKNQYLSQTIKWPKLDIVKACFYLGRILELPRVCGHHRTGKTKEKSYIQIAVSKDGGQFLCWCMTEQFQNSLNMCSL